MTWEEHEKEYGEEVFEEPASFKQTSNFYWDAENIKDFEEMNCEFALKVVKYKDKYYVVYAD